MKVASPFYLLLLCVLVLVPSVRGSGWTEDDLSVGFWIIVGIAGIAAVAMLVLFVCWCCMPVRAASERMDALPGASNNSNTPGTSSSSTTLWGTPQAYDATMERVVVAAVAVPIFEVPKYVPPSSSSSSSWLRGNTNTNNKIE
jgi:hypothetical protein